MESPIYFIMFFFLLPCAIAAPNPKRCGVVNRVSTVHGREVEHKWWKTDLTYSIENLIDSMPEATIRKAIRDAFAVFTRVTPLTFREVYSGGDINIKFGRNGHACQFTFDGNGGALAHAIMPMKGTFVHFDADEEWTVMNERNLPHGKTDFLGTAIHEIGHALGLDHESNNPNSIMYDYDKPPVDQFGNYVRPRLDAAVIRKLQRKYGSGRTAGGQSSRLFR